MLDEEINKYLSDNLKTLLSELNSLIQKFKPKDLKNTLEDIERIEGNGKILLDNTELRILLSTTSVAKKSAKYWCENALKWRVLLNKQNVYQQTQIATIVNDSSIKLKSCRIISGHVTAAGMPFGLAGANIWVIGSNNGTRADYNGYYTLPVDDDDVLRCSFIGFPSQEMCVGTQSQCDFYMLEDGFSYIDVINRDIESGLTAAVGVWVANIVPVGGQVAYGTIVVSMAVTGSAISIINQN